MCEIGVATTLGRHVFVVYDLYFVVDGRFPLYILVSVQSVLVSGRPFQRRGPNVIRRTNS